MGFLRCKEGALQLQFAIKQCSSFYDWPIRMEKDTGRYFLDTSWKTRVGWTIQFSFSLIFLGFAVFREIEALASDVVVVTRAVFVQVLIFSYLISMYCNAAFFFNGEHITNVLNMAIPFFQSYEGIKTHFCQA